MPSWPLNDGQVSKMEHDELMTLLDYVNQSSLAYVDYKTEAGHLIISKEMPGVQTAPTESTETAEPASEPVVVDEVPVVESEEAGTLVETPMVGVAYLAPQPDADPYVKVGDRVEQGQVVCLVEAMKLMNEIQAPVSGTDGNFSGKRSGCRV